MRPQLSLAIPSPSRSRIRTIQTRRTASLRLEILTAIACWEWRIRTGRTEPASSVRGSPLRRKERFMRKAETELEDELRPEYDRATLKNGVRGKYLACYQTGTNLAL